MEALRERARGNPRERNDARSGHEFWCVRSTHSCLTNSELHQDLTPQHQELTPLVGFVRMLLRQDQLLWQFDSVSEREAWQGWYNWYFAQGTENLREQQIAMGLAQHQLVFCI